MKVRISLRKGAQVALGWATDKKGEPSIGGDVSINNSLIGRITKYNRDEQSIDVNLYHWVQIPQIHGAKPIILSDAKPAPPIDENKFQDPYFKKLARVKNNFSYSPAPKPNPRAFAHHAISG